MALYGNLIEACLKAFESDKGEPYVISWPSGDTTPKMPSSGGTQSSSSPSTVTSSSAPFASESRPSPYTCYLEHTASESRTYSSARSSFNASNSLELPDLVRTQNSRLSDGPAIQKPSNDLDQQYNPRSAFNALPALSDREQIWTFMPEVSTSKRTKPLEKPASYDACFSSMGDSYSQYFQDILSGYVCVTRALSFLEL